MKAGFAARLAPDVDVWAKARAMDARVSAEAKVPWWPLVVGLPAVAFSRGYFLTIGTATAWLAWRFNARVRARQIRRELEAEVAKTERAAALEVERLMSRVDAGDEEAVFALFARWIALRPDVLQTLRFDLQSQLKEDGDREWMLEGSAGGRR